MPEKFESKTIFNNLGVLPNVKNSNGNIVDELLLSANELNIYGKSSFIEYNYKGSVISSDYLIQNFKNNPKNAYQVILKNKMEKLKSRKPSTSDFIIRPVPK
jgi:hypothetical protein